MRVARCRLAGGEHESNREDIVSTALQQVVKGVIEGKQESFNQISGFDDLLAVMRHIVRLRVTDFFRAQSRNREDGVETLPDVLDEVHREAPLVDLEEMMAEVDRLEPNPPLPQVFRDRFIEGWSTDEIAARRSINRNTLLSHFAKGFRILRQRLTRKETTP